jgi:hypothetical protein
LNRPLSPITRVSPKVLEIFRHFVAFFKPNWVENRNRILPA